MIMQQWLCMMAITGLHDCLLFVHGSKALFVPYTEMVCRLLFLYDSKALFVPDIYLLVMKLVLFWLDSKALFMPYTEIVC